MFDERLQVLNSNLLQFLKEKRQQLLFGSEKWRVVDAGNWYTGGAGYAVQGSRPAVAAPPPSQIPGLGRHADDDVGTTDASRRAVRDTDSAYVRLARQGGQPNLLSMDPGNAEGNSANVGAAKSNQASKMKPPEWYYDNAGYHNNAASDSPSQHHFTPDDQAPARQ